MSGKFAPANLPSWSTFPDIGDYGFLGDCEVSALVAPSGAIEWMCLPRPDAPSLFGSMLDRRAGYFRVGPAEISVPAERRYLPGTNVLETNWQTATGWLRVTDALVVTAWPNLERRSTIFRRTPGQFHAEQVLVRTIECTSGFIDIEMQCAPSFDYGRADASWEYAGSGYEALRCEHEGLRIRLDSDMLLGIEGRSAAAFTRLESGDRRFISMSWNAGENPKNFSEAKESVRRTMTLWRQWINTGVFPDHPWRPFLQRSALALKGLTYAPTGALLAASTTSLPETPGGERNYDYRYTWIRDSTFALWGLYTLGFHREANNFFHFIQDVAGDGAPLQIMYGVGGEKDLTESELDHLTGYDDARPVRVGNGAFDQQQHDVWGAVLDSVYLHARSRDHLPEGLWPILKAQVEAAIANWKNPDQGIWEVRGAPQHFTSSKLFCWVALDRGVRLAEMHEEHSFAEQWQSVADEIHRDICENGVDDRGVFTQHYGTTALDASMLLFPLLRFLPSDDPRIRATVLAIADELTEDGLVLRYRTEETDDGFAGEEGTFTICSFWLVSALVEIGELERAEQMCQRLLSFASELKLYAEEIDYTNGRQLGNFPQAFTHLALINAVMHVIRAQSRSGE